MIMRTMWVVVLGTALASCAQAPAARGPAPTYSHYATEQERIAMGVKECKGCPPLWIPGNAPDDPAYVTSPAPAPTINVFVSKGN